MAEEKQFNSAKNGVINQIIGPVVDVEFPDGELPDIYTALKVHLEDRSVTLEVEQHLGDNVVRTVAMAPTDGLKRRMPVENTQEPLMMPVGQETLGRIIVLRPRCGSRTRTPRCSRPASRWWTCCVPTQRGVRSVCLEGLESVKQSSLWS